MCLEDSLPSPGQPSVPRSGGDAVRFLDATTAELKSLCVSALTCISQVSPLPSLLIRDTTEYVSCSRKSWSGLAALRRRTLQRCRGPGTRTPLFPVKTCSYRLASVTRLSQPRNTLSSDFCLTRGKPGAGK